jgi:CubicO group peptidase (beta-lactamase class C family)
MMNQPRACVLTIFATLTVIPAVAAQDDPRVAQFEQGVSPKIVIKGPSSRHFTVDERLKAYGIAGLSVAIIDNGTVAFARGYGLADANTRKPVTPDTLFQAASISKGVTSVGALQLVKDGKLALDEDVNAKLSSWKVPASDALGTDIVTIRRLMSHTAGFNVHGFPGYESSGPVPTVVQVLNGTPPANTPAIKVTKQPGAAFSYSGGGYTVLQQLMLDVTHQPFHVYMHDAVLSAFGMTHSTFEQPPKGASASSLASAHYAGGAVLEGRYHLYPELAAAGLWTTPSDLSQFAIGIQRSYRGEKGAPLSKDLVTELLTPQKDDYALGLATISKGTSRRFVHGGSNAGFESKLVAYIEQGKGAVVMANSNFSGPLIEEVMASIALAYQWPDFPALQPMTVLAVPAATLSAATGDYDAGPFGTLKVHRNGDRLFANAPDAGDAEIFLKEDETFIVPAMGVDDLSFKKDATGKVVAMVAPKVGIDFKKK